MNHQQYPATAESKKKDPRIRLSPDEADLLDQLGERMGIDRKPALSFLIKNYCPMAIADMLKIPGGSDPDQLPEPQKVPKHPNESQVVPSFQ